MRKHKPHIGERRFRTWFAFLPVYVKDEQRWLKWVTVEQVYCPGWNEIRDFWYNEAFIEQ